MREQLEMGISISLVLLDIAGEASYDGPLNGSVYLLVRKWRAVVSKRSAFSKAHTAFKNLATNCLLLLVGTYAGMP